MNLLGRGPRFEPRKGCKRQSLSFHGLRDCLPGPVRTVLLFLLLLPLVFYFADYLQHDIHADCLDRDERPACRFLLDLQPPSVIVKAG